MPTIFAFPKPFRGHIGTIQRNAIGSWVRLNPQCEIFLFGDEEGAAAVAKEFTVRHIPEITRNGFGTPLLDEVFKKAEQLASDPLLCYVNCDIILGSDFIPTVRRVSQWRPQFLLVGECWNLDVEESLAFDRPSWEEDLKTLVQQKGKRRGPNAIDYFVFPSGLYQDLPPFALGRPRFDNWLIWKARNVEAAVVDATHVVSAIHQNHDYSHVGSKELMHGGEEARRNLELAGGNRHCWSIAEASHKLCRAGIRRNWGGYFTPEIKTQFRRVMELTRPLRHPLGLSMENVRRFTALLGRKP